MAPTRRVKTEEERARDDLALAGRKRRRAQQRYDAALAAKVEAEEALKLAAAVEEHAARHPVLRSSEPAELHVEEDPTWGYDMQAHYDAHDAGGPVDECPPACEYESKAATA